ncbi:hypothetical protein HOG48_01955 [Candidatus Peregrinibacteria bacterium]|jgi:hypothetical protein|nr:hypothetical protein [Candidatus Peregrinibacteria bacterium]
MGLNERLFEELTTAPENGADSDWATFVTLPNGLYENDNTNADTDEGFDPDVEPDLFELMEAGVIFNLDENPDGSEDVVEPISFSRTEEGVIERFLELAGGLRVSVSALHEDAEDADEDVENPPLVYDGQNVIMIQPGELAELMEGLLQ